MKKILFVMGIVLLLGACHMFDGHTTVVNNSSFTASFVWGGKTETINPKESASINWTFIQITNLEPDKRVKINYIDENNREIINLPSYEVRVENITNEILTLKADGWLENDMENH
jgi:ABC-type glycerol-3-phosphate transport system substrate-binding protein